MDREPIEIGRSRRPMECELTAAEKSQRSDQVHSELEVREQQLAEQETLESEAKAKKEEAKAVEARIQQLDLKIKELSQAARTGRETRQVELIKLYDPTSGEIVEKRADSGEVIPLRRAPTAQEWDAIKAAQQTTIDEVRDGKTVDPAAAGIEDGDAADPLGLVVDQSLLTPIQGDGLGWTTALAAAKALGAKHGREGVAAIPVGGAVADAVRITCSDADAELLLAEYAAGYSEGPKRRGRPKKEA